MVPWYGRSATSMLLPVSKPRSLGKYSFSYGAYVSVWIPTFRWRDTGGGGVVQVGWARWMRGSRGFGGFDFGERARTVFGGLICWQYE